MLCAGRHFPLSFRKKQIKSLNVSPISMTLKWWCCRAQLLLRPQRTGYVSGPSTSRSQRWAKARVIRAAWGPKVKLIYPEGDASHSGSEAVWPLVQAHGAPSRVLFLRGQTGREWLPEQFRRIGSDVVVLSTYIRVPLELTVPQLHRLEKAILGPSPLIYLTSTDAVDVLMHAVRPVPNARMWITRGKALTIHPRVESRLREAGFQSIELTSPDENEVIARIRESLAA